MDVAFVEMKLVVNTFQRRGTVLTVHFTVKIFYQLYITNKTECFGFKSGHAI